MLLNNLKQNLDLKEAYNCVYLDKKHIDPPKDPEGKPGVMGPTGEPKQAHGGDHVRSTSQSEPKKRSTYRSAYEEFKSELKSYHYEKFVTWLNNLQEEGYDIDKWDPADIIDTYIKENNLWKSKEIIHEAVEELDEAGKKCWPGYKKKGTQKIFGKTYNRCVKEEGAEEVEQIDEISANLALTASQKADEERRKAALAGNTKRAAKKAKQASDLYAGVAPRRARERVNNSYEPEGEELDEGQVPLKQRNKNEMQRKAGNLGREVVSTPKTKKNAEKRDAAMNRMKKLVSVIARDDERKRFETIGQSPLHNSHEAEGELVKEGKTDGKSAKSSGYSLKDWFDDGGWVQAGGKYDGEPCAKQPGQTTKPYCRDPDDRANMDKDERNRRAAKKRKEDPDPDASGKAINVTQEAAGEKDACYTKVKSRYKKWPSAYASGALVKCRKVGADNWGNKTRKEEFSGDYEGPLYAPHPDLVTELNKSDYVNDNLPSDSNLAYSFKDNKKRGRDLRTLARLVRHADGQKKNPAMYNSFEPEGEVIDERARARRGQPRPARNRTMELMRSNPEIKTGLMTRSGRTVAQHEDERGVPGRNRPQPKTSTPAQRLELKKAQRKRAEQQAADAYKPRAGESD